MYDKELESLVVEGNYDEAINICTKLIDQGDSTKYLYRASLFLDKGEYDKALLDLKVAEGEGHSSNCDRADDIMQLYGTVLWINKQETEAAEIWYQLSKDINAGKIAFSTDRAGGLVNGYLLWFAGCRNKTLIRYIEKALNFIRKGSAKTSIDVWTNPIAQYILENISEQSLLTSANTKSDILTTRRLCKAHFYIAINYYLKGDIENYIKNLQACMENGKVTMLEHEIYLAQYELTRV